MATLLLAAAVGGGGIGAGWGIALGIGASYLDNKFLFPQPDQKGPRLDDMALQSASEGSPIIYVLGQENRTPGCVIWASPLKERKHTQGKGGPSQKTYTYSVDVAIEFCEGPIDGVDKIWLNGKLFYDDTPTVAITSSQISFATTIIKSQMTPSPTDQKFMDITSPNGGPDLSVFRSGIDITVAGADNATDNGTFRVLSATIDEATGISIVRVRNQSVVNDSAGPSISLSQTPPKFSPNKATSVTIYNGSLTQLPDPTMESYLGAGNVSGYRGRAYAVIVGLQLEDYGNQLPQSQAMPRATASTENLAHAVSSIMLRAGRTAEEFDVTALSGVTLKGYAIRGPQDTVQQLQPLGLAFNMLTQEDNSVLRFFLRTAPATVTIPESDFGAHEPGENVPQRIQFKDAFTARLPNEVDFSYLDPVSDYQVGSQRERRADISPIADTILRVDSQITMTATEARAQARRILWTAWANRTTATFNLPPSWLEVLENDIVAVNYQGVEYTLLVSQIDMGANGLLQVEAQTEETQTLTQTAISEPGGAAGSDNSVFFPPDTLFAIIFSCGPLRDQDVESPGFLWGGCYADSKEPYFGADLFESQDAGATYTNVQHMDAESTFGRATTVLATAKTCYIDYKNTVTVKLVQGSLVSVTELECLNGHNRAMVGYECIGFITATLTATDTYVLSGLLRGMRNTEDFTTTHAVGDQFIQLESSAMSFLDLPLSSFGTDRDYSLVAQGGVVANYATYTHTIVHPCLRPFPPCDIHGERNGSNADILVSWKRRTRSLARVLGGTGMPLNDTIEQYVVEVWNTGESILRSTHTVDGVTEFNVTAAIQTADSLTPGNALHVEIYQVSSLVGRSYGVRATV